MTKPLRIALLVHPTLVPDPTLSTAQAAREPWRTEGEVLRALLQLGHAVVPVGVGDSLRPLEKAVRQFRPDLAFNLTEDFDGDARKDAHIVSYLEVLGVPSTGCHARGLIVAREKPLAKKIWDYHGLPTPRFVVVPRGNRRPDGPWPEFPLIVKSTCEEASAGISAASVVDSMAALRARVEFVHDTIGTDALVESFIAGRELYVGVLGGRRARAFPVWELHKPSAHAIATARWKWGGKPTDRGVKSGRARLSAAQERRIQKVCVDAYRALGLSGYARLDLRLDAHGEPCLLEANPNPHLGEPEDFARSARFGGLTYPHLIAEILNISRRRA